MSKSNDDGFIMIQTHHNLLINSTHQMLRHMLRRPGQDPWIDSDQPLSMTWRAPCGAHSRDHGKALKSALTRERFIWDKYFSLFSFNLSSLSPNSPPTKNLKYAHLTRNESTIVVGAAEMKNTMDVLHLLSRNSKNSPKSIQTKHKPYISFLTHLKFVINFTKSP